MTTENKYDPAKAAAAQEAYCEREGAPFFAPKDRCYFCHNNIYLPLKTFDGRIIEGVSVQKAGSTLITGCPFCHHSYVE